jgi:hypothetical protein
MTKRKEELEPAFALEWGAKNLERVNYFQGQLLSASDLQIEQEYFLARLRRHNHYMHGWGVVSGLTVSTQSSTEIVVEPGLALDCYGNEIHVCTPVRRSVPRLPDVQFVIINYSEAKTSPMVRLSDPAIPDIGEQMQSRIREGFQIDVVSADPTSIHRDKETGGPGSECLHRICIARLKRSGKSWKVEHRSRRLRR